MGKEKFPDKMNILFLSRWWPFPPDNGSRMRVFQLLKALSVDNAVNLVSLYESDQSNRLNQHQFCVEAHAFPYQPFKPARIQSLPGYFSKTPRSFVDTKSEDLFKKVVQLVKQNHYDLVIFSQVDMLAYRSAVSDSPCILEELEIGTYLDGIKAKKGLRRLRLQFTLKKLAAFLREESKTLIGISVVSDKEKKQISEEVQPVCEVIVVENGVDVEGNRGFINSKPLEPFSIVFAGAMTYSANFEAMKYFTHHVFPLIKDRVKEASLYITGNYFGCPIEELNLCDGIHLTGYLEDVRPRIASSQVSIAPLLTGGGTRLKILESLSLGTPVISTDKGAEGLDILPGDGVIIAKNNAEFCNAVCDVLMNKDLRVELTNRGLAAVSERYSWEKTLMPFKKLPLEIGRKSNGN
jgi:glycosyltransferase involved in cell wall biosynthesis